MIVFRPAHRRALTSLASLASLTAVALLSACSLPKVDLSQWLPSRDEGTPRKEIMVAVTEGHELIRFNAGQPGRIVSRAAITGLPAGDALVGIDYRVARGVLYALSRQGQLYTLDADTGALTPVGNTPVPLVGEHFGFDFNPAADRIRVVSDTGLNLRLHPDTGAIAARDPYLTYQWQSANPRVAAAGYTYNQTNDKLTTNYAIDLANGNLLTQGSVEGQVPAVSPNTGTLRPVGSLGLGALEDASMDITDTDNTALGALRTAGRTSLYLIDLGNGQTRRLGQIADGQPLRGVAIVP